MMNDEYFDKLFPWPADRPLRRVRFGNPPVRGEALPGPENQSGTLARPEPWSLEWADDELGIDVGVRLHRESGELWAYVTSPRADYLGKAVSVGLVGEGEDRLRRVTVSLDETTPNGCSGAARIAPLEEVHDELGPEVELFAFLLE